MLATAKIWPDSLRKFGNFCGRRLSGECTSDRCNSDFHYSIGRRFSFCMVSGTFLEQAIVEVKLVSIYVMNTALQAT